MKIQATLFTLIILCSACKKHNDTETPTPLRIENQIFDTTLAIDGHAYDGAIVSNCIFENITGDGLEIRDVNNLTIENCTFRNISKNAIRFRNSGISDGVKIIKNQIYDIGANGILAPENHSNTLIQGNTIYNVAIDTVSSQFGAPHHGIYFQGIGVTITQNTIHDVINDQGNCISIRTYGTLSRNKLYNAPDHGISYYSDHPGNGETLLIENNLIYDNGKRGINLVGNGNTQNYIGNALMRFNTIISATQSPIGINAELTNVTLDIPGNILIRTDGGSTYVYSDLPYTQSHNITESGDIGFVDFLNRDLKITSASIAVGAATGLTAFPDTDYEGNPRNGENLDAGAFEI